MGTIARSFMGVPTLINAESANVYGVAWDEAADTYTRLGALAGETLGVSPGNAKLPLHARIRRCILNDDGTVNYYLSASDSTKKEDGVTDAVLDGCFCLYCHFSSGIVYRSLSGRLVFRK